MRSVPVATACELYHRFFECVSLRAYEPYLVAMSCIYLAGKVEEQHLRTRDIINLDFHVSFRHPHKYLLHYLLSVKALVNRHAWTRTPVAETAWALLRDCYHGPMCIHHAPQHIAIATLYLALNSYGVEMPVGEREWWQYLLHYLLSVKALVNRHAWTRTPVAETAWALLRDCYHGPMCIHHAPQHIAIATLYLALNSYGVEMPVGEREWWQVLCEDITKGDINAVIFGPFFNSTTWKPRCI
ncbi:hypothetical protein CRUP_038732 [Coryphaenoides rupestris]|nr:hypothetical protein CRUP_038732 [Coryphaenoides rupestris]